MKVKSQIFRIENFFCLSCDSKISEALNGLAGIVEYKTNLYTKEIYVKYDSNKIKKHEIFQCLKSKGFQTGEIHSSHFRDSFMLIGFFVYKGYQNFIHAHNFYFIFIFSSILQFYNIKNIITFSKVSKNILVSLSSLLCYILGVWLFFYDEYLVNPFEYLSLSIDILMYLLASSLILDFIVRLSKVNFYAITRIKKQYVKQIKKEGSVVIELERIREGDFVFLSEGIVYFDCEIVKGNCLVDESDITGEDCYKEKDVNEKLFSSTRIVEGEIIVKVIRVGKQSYTGKILSLIEDSSFKDYFCSQKKTKLYNYFIFLLSLSLSCFFYFRSVGDWEEINFNAFKVFLMPLTSLCPCVFVISEPLICLRARKYFLSIGVLVNNYSKLFNRFPNLVLLDKTGTLTKGTTRVISYKIYENETFNRRLILQMEENYKNTIYGSIYRELKGEKNFVLEEKVEYVSSGGLRVFYLKKEYRLGTKRFVTGCNNSKRDLIDKYYKKERVVYFSVQFKITGFFILSDNLKESSQGLIESIKENNLRIILFSGDQKENVKRVAKKLKIYEFLCQQTSKDKLNTVLNYSKGGYRCLTIGDGTNDIPSFKASSLSISVNLDNSNSDLVFLSGDLNTTGLVLQYLKKVYRKNLFNYLFSVGYNLIMIVYLIKIKDNVEINCFSMLFPLTVIIVNSLCL